MTDGNELYIVFYSDSKYEYQTKGVIESALLNIKGDFKLIYYTIGFDSNLDYKNLTKIRLEKNDNLPKFEYYKPSILIDSINRFGDKKFLFVDTDIIFGRRFSIDKILNSNNFPMLSQGNWEFPFSVIEENGEVIKRTDESNLMNYMGVKSRTMMYVYTCIISYNKECFNILKEWYDICNNQFLLENRVDYFPFPDETPMNVILWKHGIKNNFGRIYLNTLEFEPLKFTEENEGIKGNSMNNGLFNNDLLRCDNSSDVVIYHGIKDELQINRSLSFFKESKKKVFITFSEGKKYEEMCEKLKESIKMFSNYELIIFRKEDFDIKWQPDKWQPGYIYIYKILSCIKAMEMNYDDFIWVDNDIIVSNNIDKAWERSIEIVDYPLLPKHRLYNHNFNYKSMKDDERLKIAKERVGLYHNNYNDYYLHACFMLFNKNCINFYKEVLRYFDNFDSNVFPYGDETILNCLIWKKSGNNLGNIFICTEYFSPTVVEMIMESDKLSYPEIFDMLSLPIIENNFDDILFYHGTKDIKLQEYYLKTLKKNKTNKQINSNEAKSLYIKSIDSSNIIIRDKIEKPKLEILTNFVNGPTIELKGKSEEKFNIEFYDSKDNLSYKTTISSNMWSRSNKKYFQDWKIKINNDIIKYNAKGKRVYIALDSRALGDNIAWIPYVEEFRKKHDAEVIVSTFWNKLFKNKYTNLNFVEPGMQVNNLYAMYKIGWFYNSDMEPEEPSTIPLQKTCSNILGLDFTEIKPEIYFKPGKRPIEEKYVCISPFSTAGLKHWNNKNGWSEVIEYLTKSGYKVVNVCLDNYNNKDVINIKDKSIESTMNWLHHSELLIGLSSGLSWLSWAIGKHVVMISNFTEENHEFVSNCTRIINKSVCNSCWNNPNFKFDKGDWNWCPIWKGTDKQFECHTSITSDMVIEKIKNLL